MNVYRVAFIGHRRVKLPPELKQPMDAVMKKLLRRRGHLVFSVGFAGAFDKFARLSVDDAKKTSRRKKISLLLIPHIPIKYNIFFSLFYDEILYPIAFERQDEEAVIERDVWVIEHSDIVIAYVEPDRQDMAYDALRYAENIGVKTVNLAVQNEVDVFLAND